MKTPASLAGDVLNLAATGMLITLQFIHYPRSLRPSSVVSLYFSAYVLLAIARARTLWTISPASNAAVTIIATLSLTFLALLVETTASTQKVVNEKVDSPEQYSGIWARTIFAWLAATFKAGYATVISVDDLPALGPKLTSRHLHQKLLLIWTKSK